MVAVPTAQDPEQQKSEQWDGRQQQLLGELFHFAQFHRRHEPADQHAAPEQGHILARLHGRHAGHAFLAKKVNDRAADGDLAAHVHEDRQYAQNDVRVFQGARARLNFPFAHVRQFDDIKHGRQRQKHQAKGEVRDFDRIRAVRTGSGKVLEDEVAADERAGGGADGIERLRQIQPARSSVLRPENSHVGVGRDLQHGESEADDEQSHQKQGIGDAGGRRPEEGAAKRGNQEANHHAVLVADAGDGIARRHGNQEIGQRTDEIRAKERKLHQHGLEIIQGERLFETGNKYVIEDRHEAPHEKEDGHDRERAAIVLAGCGMGGGGWLGGGGQAGHDVLG